MKRIPKEGLNLAQLAAMAAQLKEAATAELVKLREAAATELYAVIALVQRAIQALLYPANPNAYVDVYAIYPDRVIVRDSGSGRLFAFSYSLDASNNVTLGPKGEVVEDYVPVSLKEAAAEPGFLEAVNEEGSVWDVVVVKSGLSLNGNYYPDAVLREAVPLFEGARVFAKSDAEHLKGEGKSVHKIAGWIQGVKFVEGKAPDTGRVVGQLHISAAASGIRTLVADAFKRGKRDLVGLSIDAEGKAKTAMREGKKVREAQRITKVASVDLIVEPGAGGQLIRMVESFNSEEQEDTMLRKQMLDTIKAKTPKAYAKIDAEKITDDALMVAFQEAVANPEQPESASSSAAAAASAAAAGGLTLEQVREETRMVEARANARAKIAESKLPAPAKAKLVEEFASRERFTEADVDARIKGEREYLARFTESGRVTLDLGEGNVSVEDRSKKIGQMLDDFFARDPKKPMMSFKECYIEITGDRRVTGRLEDADRSRLREALGANFRESLESTSFVYVLGDSITRRMVADYNTPNEYDGWQRVATAVPVSDFRTQERTRYGGYGDLPIVNQSDPYNALASPTDEHATYAAAKRGGTEDVTLEMIKNDDVGAIQRIPGKLSRAAKRTLAKFVFDFYRTNPVIYDGNAFFHAAHSNLFATALDATQLGLHRLAMLKQAELNSADRLGIAPKTLLVPFDLQETAVNLFNRSTNLDKTFLQNLVMDVLPVWYWTDTNDWCTVADPADIPVVEIGFLDGRQEPELFVQDNPTVGSMFSNDKLTWKIRHVYGGNVLDFRGATKAVV